MVNDIDRLKDELRAFLKHRRLDVGVINVSVEEKMNQVPNIITGPDGKRNVQGNRLERVELMSIALSAIRVPKGVEMEEELPQK
jgi:hypothetical protein